MPDRSTLQSQYAVQIQRDLASNVEERERVTAQISELQGQLTVLEGNHVLLTAMQQTLGTGTPVAPVTRRPESRPGGGFRGPAPLPSPPAAVRLRDHLIW
ncbi:hypothetical protein [Streptomyces violascens]|uniref:hypothetical protein n=1 Tax=Streptomyces violascens TaxID=67381 RepID=UPI0036565748